MKLYTSIDDRTAKARLWLREAWAGPSITAAVCWRPPYLFGCDVAVGGEDRDMSLYLTLLWLSVTLAVSNAVPRSWKNETALWYGVGRTTGLHVSRPDGGTLDKWWDIRVSVDVWHDWTGWSSDQFKSWPWQSEFGWTLGFRPIRWMVGALEYEKGEISAYPGVVEMPERSYEAEVEIMRVRWNRRWRKGRWRWRTTVSVKEGVPHPGKGTSAWNCGDDATYSISFAPEDEPLTPSQACARFADDVLGTRKRYPL